MSEAQLYDLESEATKIKWDIIGLSEVRRRGEGLLTLPSGNALHYKEREDQSQVGIGFLINKKWLTKTEVTNFISDRVAYIPLNIRNNKKMKIIQVYAPTSSYSDLEVEEV